MITDKEFEFKKRAFDRMRESAKETAKIANDVFIPGSTLPHIISMSVMTLEMVMADIMDEILMLRKEVRELESHLVNQRNLSCNCHGSCNCSNNPDQIASGNSSDSKRQE